MAKAILIYGSTTGNTEELSEHVASGLKQAGVDVTVENVIDANIEELNDYDAIVFGCSTWGIGELQDDFLDFNDEIEKISLDGKKSCGIRSG